MNQSKLSSTSKVADKLCSPESVHDAAYLTRTFQTNGTKYDLEARILYNQQHEAPWVLSIHGALGDYSKANPLLLELQDKGISTLGITMSGHSAASPLAPEETTLANNIHEAEAFFADLNPRRPAVVMGFSLGGTPALKLLEKYANRIDKLILFYPGIYNKDSYAKPYGEPFRSVISAPYSYRQNDTIALLKRFPGKVLLVKGEYDGLDPADYGKPAGGSAGEVEVAGQKFYSPIPKEVIDMIQNAVPADRQTYIEIPGCDHRVFTWMRTHPQESRGLIDDIAQFISV